MQIRDWDAFTCNNYLLVSNTRYCGETPRILKQDDETEDGIGEIGSDAIELDVSQTNIIPMGFFSGNGGDRNLGFHLEYTLI